MGRRKRRTRDEKQRDTTRAEKTESYTLPPSPSHSFTSSSSSSSSSDFEFSISISPRKSSTLLCPADELFYKGQLLPLHLSPRISMVRTLLLSSPPSNYSAPRDSTASTTSSSSSFITNDCDSSRPSSATDDENHFINRHNHHHISNNNAFSCNKATTTSNSNSNSNSNRYFSFSRFSSVFRKPRGETESVSVSESSSSVKRMGNTAKEVIRKCLKKVKKPLSGKFSQKQQKTASSLKTERSRNVTGVCSVKNKKEITESDNSAMLSSSSSFSGNLKYPRRKNNNYVSSCPSSMRSSPTRSGVLSRSCYSDASTMEELQNAIQGAITHCKNSLVQNNKSVVSSEI